MYGGKSSCYTNVLQHKRTLIIEHDEIRKQTIIGVDPFKSAIGYSNRIWRIYRSLGTVVNTKGFHYKYG